MKHYGWQTLLGVLLVILSTIFYILHYVIFRDPHHIFIFLIGDIAFVFTEVLLVTLIIHRVLEKRDKQGRLKKLNMVIGTFFSEVGIHLLRDLAGLDSNRDQVKAKLTVDGKWSKQSLLPGRQFFKAFKFELRDAEIDWDELKKFLLEKREFLLRLLENPNVLEHESFTDLLHAVFHLAEELGARSSLTGLPVTDQRHLEHDVERVYQELCAQWMDYMNYLKNSYPYLFSLALRMNPFDAESSVLVETE